MTVVSAATGGAGLTETVIGLANQWAAYQRVLVIEANPLTATMAARLRRPTGFGLGWALGLAAQNQPIFPNALTPAAGPTGRGLGDFDVICQSSTPGGPSPASPTHLHTVVDAALGRYDQVLVEIGPLVLESSPGLDRFAAGRGLLARADQIIVVAGADPEAVVQLAEWKAAARTLKVAAPCWALFGRTPKGNYETSHLRGQPASHHRIRRRRLRRNRLPPRRPLRGPSPLERRHGRPRPVAYRHQSAGPPTRRANHRHLHRTLDRQPAGPHPPGPGESQAKRMVVTTTATPFERLLARVHGILNTRNIADDPDQIRSLIETEVESWQRSAIMGADGATPFSDPDDVVERIIRLIEGVGTEIETLVADPDVEEIYGTDGDLSYRTTSGHTKAVPTPVSPTALLHTIQRLVASASEALDASHPRADGLRVTLPGGRQGRLSASIPPRIEGTVSFVLRLPQKMHVTLDDLVTWGSLTPPAASFLKLLMRTPRPKILVSGSPGAGKTAMVDALLRSVTARQRTIVLEEQRELTAPLLSGEYWATSKVEDLAVLIRSARVASPQVIVLGELKGVEAWDLLMAGNLGTGVIAAVHADSTAKAFDALADAASPAVPAMSTTTIREKFSRTFDIVIYCGMDPIDDDRTLRQITEIAVVPPQMSDGAVAVTPIFSRAAVGEPMELSSTEVGPHLAFHCERALRRYPGVTLTNILHGEASL